MKTFYSYKWKDLPSSSSGLETDHTKESLTLRVRCLGLSKNHVYTPYAARMLRCNGLKWNWAHSTALKETTIRLKTLTQIWNKRFSKAVRTWTRLCPTSSPGTPICEIGPVMASSALCTFGGMHVSAIAWLWAKWPKNANFKFNRQSQSFHHH